MRSPDNFRQNLAIALVAGEKSQSDLAKHLKIARSAVNQWTKGSSRPEKTKLQKIAEFLSVDPEELESQHPFQFGTTLGLTRLQVEEALDEKSGTIYLTSKNFVTDRNDFILDSFCGTYVSYMPSWIYKDMINFRSLQIFFRKDAYYYRERHLGFRDVEDTEYSGQVGRVGNNIHLIGEEITGLRNNNKRPRELMFGSLKTQTNSSGKVLYGICLGSDPVHPDMTPVASPYYSEMVSDESDIATLEKHTPAIPYINQNDLGDGEIIKNLRSIKQTWLQSDFLWT